MKVNKKNIKYGIDNHHHGLFVKEARLRQGYRLTEVANEICHASYLSKVESGRLFPRTEIFEKIVEKLGIQFPTEDRLCPIEIFRKALYQKDMSLVDPYLKNNMLHHYEIQLIKFFRAVVTEHLTEAFEFKKKIDQFNAHFNVKEEQAYLLFSGVYLFKNFEWEEGRRCLEKSFELTQEVKKEDPYLCFELAKYYFQLQKVCMGFSYLARATVEFKKMFEKTWVFECDMLWCRESVRNGDIKHVEMKLEEWKKLIEPSRDHLQWSSLFNVLALVCEKRGQLTQAEEYYLKSVEEREGEIKEECIIDIIKFYYRGQNRDQLIKLIERLNLSRLSAKSRMLADFYYLKITDEINEYFESFLKKDAIPFAMKGLDHQHAALYTRELANYYRKKLSYKKVADAYYVWEKFCDTLNLTNRILTSDH
ncbi:MAG: helix-turn-helix domain-containing protein [Defluviitaleaceae bacterium]|nr:helix-turn-helix domain-containing protein [Defluviitaleaceae bacterium]